MAKNRKTVRKGFSYLQCDDFADYLSQMAAQGWHFKEWGAGLVFEKGEPEDAVYAVEVFIKGSSYDLRPSADALDFSDYCEQAGWKLMDSKQKYCIFKQMRPDAIPIVTPEERIQNATKAYRNQLIWQVVLSVLWLFNMLLRFLPTSRLIDTLFSGVDLTFAVYWVIFSLYTIAKCVWFGVWVQKAKKRCDQGDVKLLSRASETHTILVHTLLILVLTAGIAATGEYWLLLAMLGITPIIIIPALLMAKIRPDRETNIGIQVAIPIILTIFILISVTFVMSAFDSDSPSADTFPLQYIELDNTVGEVDDTFHTSSSSIFGETAYYSLHYKNASLSYEIYETEQDWILDIIWDYYLTYERNSDPIDCTALWDANSAFYNHTGEYYVRCDNSILIFDLHKAPNLTEEQVAIIRNALGLE